MATLAGMVRRHGQRGTARILTSQGFPVTVNTIKRAVNNPKSTGALRINDFAKALPTPSKLVDPGERNISSQKVRDIPNKTKMGFYDTPAWHIAAKSHKDKNGELIAPDVRRAQVEALRNRAEAEYHGNPVINVTFYGTMINPSPEYTAAQDDSGANYYTWNGPWAEFYRAWADASDTVEERYTDRARFIQSTVGKAQARAQTDSDFARELAFNLTGNDWLEVSAMWIWAAKTFQRAASL